MSEKKLADIGMIGLAVMGENLVLNMESKGFTVAVYNRSPERTREFIAGRADGKNILPAYSPAELCAALRRPRRIMMMVKAGSAVDDVIAQLLPLLEPGDILIDGGNSHYRDTERRVRVLAEKKIPFVGTGVSGGEKGALKGPSLMPGGNSEARPFIEPLFKKIAATAPDGSPCCEWIGPGGSGHFVKTVHNGIEYADMQLIAEAYLLLRSLHDYSMNELAEIFRRWNDSPQGSYLLEITAKILEFTDPETGRPMVDMILDRAGQKGTGRWTSEAALELGIPAATIAEAVFARAVSACKTERMRLSELFPERRKVSEIFREQHKKDLVNYTADALYASKICVYAQGFDIMKSASEQFGWELDSAKIASIWRGGCIIRAKLLDNIREAYSDDRGLRSLISAPFFRTELQRLEGNWRFAVVDAVTYSVPVPAFSSAIAWFDSWRSANLSANLIQAQRDFFGAHTYERTDRPEGEFFHTAWTGASNTNIPR